jgi:NitT/TauT family transport system permease protein
MAEILESPAALGTELPVAAPPPSGRSVPSFDFLSKYALPLVIFAVFLAIWQIAPHAFNIPTYELPDLWSTLTAVRDEWGDIGIALLVTLQDALVGFIIGNTLAILGATLFAYSSTSERAFYPLAIVIQTVPIIVYVPLLRILFFKIPLLSSNSDAYAVVGVTVLISFFPTLVNMNVGFKTIDPRIFELMKLLNASRTQIFLKLRFPSAIPFLFSSLKITATLAFVGAVVGEYMAGSGINPIGQALSDAGVQQVLGFPSNPSQAAGIGYLLSLMYFRVDKPGVFAAVLTVTILSILFFSLMVLLEKLLVPWRKSQ